MKDQEQLYVDWNKRNYNALRIGGTWVVPRSGLIFTKTATGYELSSMMPWIPAMASSKLKVPRSASELSTWQRDDFNTIKHYHQMSGLTVTDPNKLLVE